VLALRVDKILICVSGRVEHDRQQKLKKKLENRLASKQAKREELAAMRLTHDAQAMLAVPRKHSLGNGLKKLRAVAGRWRHRNGCLATTEGGHLMPLRATRVSIVQNLRLKWSK
jgi:hypothetical protein